MDNWQLRASLVIRFLTNVILARLLGPEILGVIVVAQAVRAGTELLTVTVLMETPRAF